MTATDSEGGIRRQTGTTGPVALTPGAHAALRPLEDGAALAAGTLLGDWQRLNREATLDHCIEHLESAGNLHNLRRLVGDADGPFRGYWFADSDIHKVLEAVGWETGRAGDAGWAAFTESTVDLLRRAQEDDGYLNSWIQGRGERRWDGLVESHELYCLGHLIQAAVAVDRAGAGDELLAIARRFTDLVVRDLGEGGRDIVDGHPEIETALVELYRHTGEEDYLGLASRMVELRGRGLLQGARFGSAYLQDHLPVREATEAIGHAVRQTYLAAGVTDLYLETGDASLLEAMEALWRSAFHEKTYITGAHGSRHRDEAFGDPYELPPDRAYAETCAAIASFMWNWRMLLATGDGRYAEEMERALYNAIAVATAIDGRSFFYSNPLQLRTGHDGSTEDAPSERLTWYACACCPPNLARLVASLGHYLATRDAEGIQLNLLAAGRIETATPSGTPVALTVETAYPWDGRAEIAVEGPQDEWTLALRIPAWCEAPSLAVDGKPVDATPDEHGYVRLRRAWPASARVVLELPMPVRVLAGHPRIDAVRGCVALARGPLVYCIEQADHPGVELEDLRLDPASPPRPAAPDDALGVPVTLAGSATARPASDAPLYAPHGGEPPAGEAAELTAIPYFRWANRGPNAMRVWIPTA